MLINVHLGLDAFRTGYEVDDFFDKFSGILPLTEILIAETAEAIL